jgi:hypothetical protein
MTPSDELVPRPPIVRERLAQSLREIKFLKKLLRLSVERAEERHKERTCNIPQTATGQGGDA